MNLETLVTLLIVGMVVATIIRLFAGWSLASWLLTFVLAVLGGVGGWQLERQLHLPSLYAFPFPTDQVGVSVVWSSVGALVLALVGAFLARPAQRRPLRSRRLR